MPPLPLPMYHLSIRAGGLKALTEALGPFHHLRRLGLTVLTISRHPSGCRWTSRPIPIWRALRAHAVGALIQGHDVSGTARQTLGRAMQSTTTMMPVRQCGHSRSDCPVSASNRSR
jgi:hypothetical protein